MTRLRLLEEKARVVLAYDAEATGRIVRLGSETSEVKFDDGGSRFIPNKDLKPIGDEK